MGAARSVGAVMDEQVYQKGDRDDSRLTSAFGVALQVEKLADYLRDNGY